MPATAVVPISSARKLKRRRGLTAYGHSSNFTMSIKDVYNANSLYNGYLKAKEGVEWKESTQRYEANLLLNILNTQKALRSKTYKARPMSEFTLYERGHTRRIKAQHISDRVVQRSFNDNVLIPRVRDKLIYDNSASLKGKGLAFSRRRFEQHLRNAYKEYGKNAYVLLMDFKKYYDNVRHDKAFEEFGQVLEVDEMEFLKLSFDDFRVDVSYMTDEEYRTCMDGLFDALKHANIPNELKTGERYMPKSLGIGNQSAQITGVFYPNRIDHYCKTVRGIKYYGRYMDDTYIIMQGKESLKELYREIKVMCDELGIFINETKTHIRKITGWVPWLKINYCLKPTGGLIRKVSSATFKREHRKLKKFRKLYEQGRMSLEHIRQCYRSWRGTYRKYDSGTRLKKMDDYFNLLFGKDDKYGKQHNTRN